MTVRVDSNAGEIAREITEHGVKAGYRASLAVTHFGLLLQTQVKRNASLPRSGPPGPRLQTGDYVRSIYLRTAPLLAEVGTNKPQAMRLEFGFAGIDSLGRVYDQPPYPHFGPALDTIEVPFMAALAGIATEGW